VVDLRYDSATYKRYFQVVLSAENRLALYVARGLAHGYLTLEDSTEVLYQLSGPYRPEAARGVRWNDPAFGIQWPEEIRCISERDRSFPDFQETANLPVSKTTK